MMNLINVDTSRSLLNPSISVTKLQTPNHHQQRPPESIYKWGVCEQKLSLTNNLIMAEKFLDFL